jgi:hypothetical protein
MQALQGKKILIFQQRGWAINIGHFLAIKLQSEGCRLAALTLRRTTHEFVLNQKEVNFEMIASIDEIKEDAKKYLGGDDYTFAEICEALGIDSVWPLIHASRVHVKSYRKKYYYSYKQNVDDEELVLYIKAVYKCIKNIFNDFDPDLIITPNFATTHHLMFYYYARKRGLKMLALVDSKIVGIDMFSYDYNYSSGPLFERLAEIRAGKEVSQNLDKAKAYIKDFRQKFKEPETFGFYYKSADERNLIQKIRHFLSPYRSIVGWYYNKERRKNKNDKIGPTIDYRPPKIILRDHYCREYYKKYAENFPYDNLNKIGKFIYFPLQVQPEEAIDVIAPFFSNQVEIARLIALSLPDDYTLVVKEHPAMVGYRSPSYFRKLKYTPNVKLIDYRILSQKVLGLTDLVISPGGTIVAEAAFLNKPAIQLGNLGTTLALPNVFKHTDLTSMSKKIKDILSTDLRTDDYEKNLESFVAAAFDTGFNLSFTKIWEKNIGDKERLVDAYVKEIKKLI